MSRQKTFGPTIIKDKYGNPVKAMTHGQHELMQAIEKYDIVFVNGPAGTGKTFLAACAAVAGLQEGKYKHVSLSRPAVVSGEELGFLPGSLEDKIAPYMKPLYESIEKLKPKPKKVTSGNEKGKRKRKRVEPQGWDDNPVEEEEVEWAKKVEIAPLEYMRGSTMENAFVILDEAQNATPAQIKLLLTRMGWGTKIVITGDASQSDLARRIGSGFRHAQHLLKNVKGIGFVHLTDNDIVRHKLVKDIIKCYEKEDNYNNHSYSNHREEEWEHDSYDFDEIVQPIDEFNLIPIEQVESYNKNIDILKI